MLDAVRKNCPYVLLRPLKSLYGSIPYEVRLGRRYHEFYSFLQQTRGWTEQQRGQYQLEQLQKLLRHAYLNVPYYRRVFDENGLKPGDIRSFSDMKKLPYLTRQIIREHQEELVAINFGKSELRYQITGGTTGVPMGFFDQKRVSDQREWAFITFLWEDVGYDIHKVNRSVILRGVIPAKGHYEYKGSNLILSTVKMNSDNMSDYVRRIARFDPDYIQAYPSSISILSGYILRHEIEMKLRNLKAVICSSEVLYDSQRQRIEEAFRSRVYSFYGHSERSCLAGDCGAGRGYRLVGEYGFTEFINNDGEDAVGDDEPGEIVCTGFNNYAFPFIRYRTGDIVINAPDGSERDKSRTGFKSVRGRAQDYLVDARGELVPFMFSDNALWPIKDKISAYQYVQFVPGAVRLYIEPVEELSSQDLLIVGNEFRNWFPSMKVEVGVKRHIERTGHGKLRYLVQHLPVDTEAAGIPAEEAVYSSLTGVIECRTATGSSGMPL
jgi:phenylacetate-CoA ligase